MSAPPAERVKDALSKGVSSRARGFLQTPVILSPDLSGRRISAVRFSPPHPATNSGDVSQSGSAPSQQNGSALSRGERVDRDGAFTSRRGPGEGSAAQRGEMRLANTTAFRGRQAAPLRCHTFDFHLVVFEESARGVLHAGNGLLVSDFPLDQTQLRLRQLRLGIQHEENLRRP
jgi:hypothetical protein